MEAEEHTSAMTFRSVIPDLSGPGNNRPHWPMESDPQEENETRRPLSKLVALLKRLVPLGYEDAAGFHFGEPARFEAWTN